MDLAIIDWVAGGLMVGSAVGGALKSIAPKGKGRERERVPSRQQGVAQCGYCRRDAVGYHAGLKQHVCEDHLQAWYEQQRQRSESARAAQQRVRRPEPMYEEDEEWEDEGDGGYEDEEWEDGYGDDLYGEVETCQHGFEVGRCKACYEIDKRRRAIAAAQQTYVQTTEPVPRLRQSQVARQLGNRRGPLPTQSSRTTQRPVQRLAPPQRQRPVQQQVAPQRQRPVQQQVAPQRRRRQYVEEEW